MATQNSEDNIYKVGTIMLAKEAPTVKLQIKHYNQRIYYCTIVDDASAKQKVYFEREFIKPGDQAYALLR